MTMWTREAPGCFEFKGDGVFIYGYLTPYTEGGSFKNKKEAIQFSDGVDNWFREVVLKSSHRIDAAIVDGWRDNDHVREAWQFRYDMSHPLFYEGLFIEFIETNKEIEYELSLHDGRGWRFPYCIVARDEDDMNGVYPILEKYNVPYVIQEHLGKGTTIEVPDEETQPQAFYINEEIANLAREVKSLEARVEILEKQTLKKRKYRQNG